MNATNDAAEKLNFALAAYKGEFALLGVECETESQSSLVSDFEQTSSLKIKRIKLAPTDKLLLDTLSKNLAQTKPECAIVEGLDQVRELDEMLIAANLVRDEFKKQFQFPLIILFNQETWVKLFRLAPDFESVMIKLEIQPVSTVENLLAWVETQPGWKGNDFEECLEIVKKTRLQTDFFPTLINE